MDISPTLVRELAEHGIAYDIVHHHHSDTSLNIAHAAHVPVGKMVKTVILEDEGGYVMALIPANRKLQINKLNKALGRYMSLASEPELLSLFADCELGAIPPVGEAYGIKTVVDSHLDECEDVYIEAGNHNDLLHLSKGGFHKLTADYQHEPISLH
jgi:Ala-tRNA(Pro) deacylase